MQAKHSALRLGRLAITLVGLLAASAAMATPEDALNRYYELKRSDPEAAFVYLSGQEPDYRDDVRIQLELGYHLVSKGASEQAIPYFNRAAALAPGRAEIWKQLGYARKDSGKDEDAIEAFARAQDLTPDDEQVSLELAFLNQRVGHNREASAIFQGLSLSSQDKETAARACESYAALRGVPDKVMPDPFFAESYVAPEYNSHWNLGVYPLQAKVGAVLSEQPIVEAYIGVRAGADTRSGSGPFGTQIYNDNVAVVAAGLRARPARAVPLYLYVEAGPAYDITRRNRDRWRADVRGGFVFYDEWGTEPPCGGKNGEIQPIADLYADGIYYSRYDDNILFFARARPGLRLLDTGKLALDAYGLAAVGFDTKDVAFNNFEELGGGLALRLYGPGTLTLRAEAVRVFRPKGLDSYSTLRVRVEHYIRF